MQCSVCKTANDPDAIFCQECGVTLDRNTAASAGKPRKAYVYMFVLIPVLAIVVGLGYYKFFLPDGIAAVVNGEEIRLSELDEVIGRTQGPGNGDAPAGMLRRQVLQQMIIERIVLQEAQKAETSVQQEEINSASAELAKASGSDAEVFKKEMQSQYGSMLAFESALQRTLTIKKFLSEKVVPRNADPLTARLAVDRWIQDMSSRANVRIALAGPGGGPGCGGCGQSGKGPCDMKGAGVGQSRKGPCKMQGADRAPETTAAQDDRTSTAAAAGLRYWRAKHGQEDVTTQVKDFGCHFQVNIVRHNSIIGSLRYQNGNITEM
jgi:hypothetical protein